MRMLTAESARGSTRRRRVPAMKVLALPGCVHRVQVERPTSGSVCSLRQDPESLGEIAEFGSRPWAGELEEVSGNGPS
jgi:hypothetical protein